MHFFRIERRREDDLRCRPSLSRQMCGLSGAFKGVVGKSMCEAATIIQNDGLLPHNRSAIPHGRLIIGYRIMKFFMLFMLTFLAQMLAIHQVNALLPCQVELCTTRHAQQMEDRVIFPSRSVDYCQTLGGYITCLNATIRSCHSMLDFHSARTAANQRWRRFHCDEFAVDGAHQPNFGARQEKCKFWESISKDGSSDASNFLHCSIFGRGMHLQRFVVHNDADVKAAPPPQLTRCAFRGARPMIDNRFFIVQLSTADDNDDEDDDDGRRTLHNATPSKRNAAAVEATLFRRISKVVVLIKPHAECVTTQKLYEASSSPRRSGASDDADKTLPVAFSDGTTEVVTDDGRLIRSAIEVVRVDDDDGAEFLTLNRHHHRQLSTTLDDRRGDSSVVELRLHYLDTVVRIRREAADHRLSVFVRAPRRLMHSEYDGMPTAQLCSIGARSSATDEAHGGCGMGADCRANVVNNVVMDNDDVCAGGEAASVLFVRTALSNALLFQQCVLTPLHHHRLGIDNASSIAEFILPDVAQSKCEAVGVRDAFFDACIFDAITTPRWPVAVGGDQMEPVCQSVVDAQRFTDVKLSAPEGRKSLDVYAADAALMSRLARRCAALGASLTEDNISDGAAPTAYGSSISALILTAVFSVLLYVIS